MAISILGAPVYTNQPGFSSSTVTQSVTVSAGTKLLVLMAEINDYDWSKLTSLTVNGSASGVTQQVTSQPALASKSMRIWTVTNPTAGTYNVVWTFTTSSNNGGGYLSLCLDGVDTTTPVTASNVSSVATSSSPTTTTITVPAGGWAVGGFFTDGGSPVRDASQTVLGTDQANHSFSYKQDATQFQFTSTGTIQGVQAVIAVNPAAAAGTTINCTVGNAVAAGVTASIQQSSSTTINCGVGNAVAAGVAAGVATNIVSDVLHNNNGTIHANQAVVYDWYAGGRIGSGSGVTSSGSGTTNAQGRLVTNIARVAGILMVAKQNSSALNDNVYYEAF